MLAELLSCCETFADLGPDRLRALAAHSTAVSVTAGSLVFAHGDPADAVYLLVEGHLTVFRDQVGKPMQLLARLGPGELLGELCLFDEGRRTASARATGLCRLLRMEREHLLALLEAEPHVALRIQNAAARRSSRNSAAALDLGQQAELRIRLRTPVRLRLEDGVELSAELANLSVGGLSLVGAPEAWSPGRNLRFDLLFEADALPVAGRVAWRNEDTVGIAFVSPPAGHERHVYRLLRRLAEPA